MFEADFLREIEIREKRGEGCIKFNIKFLDDTLKGIFPSDLVLIGARSGAGKTQLCCEILESALTQDKKVLYVALEAEDGEIESRIKYKVFMDLMYKNQTQGIEIEQDEWMLGRYIYKYPVEENTALEICREKYKNAFIRYKSDRFNVDDLIETITVMSEKVDLIIIDHVHYFDYDDENENRAIKLIAKTARMLALENCKPIVLVAHLRKADKKMRDLAPDMDEFHGSSDLAKIATKIITLAPGKNTLNGSFETFMRIPKNRFGGGNPHFVGRMYFSKKGRGYEGDYEVGWANQEEFEPLIGEFVPKWARKKSEESKPRKMLHNYAPHASVPYADD